MGINIKDKGKLILISSIKGYDQVGLGGIFSIVWSISVATCLPTISIVNGCKEQGFVLDQLVPDAARLSLIVILNFGSISLYYRHFYNI